MAPTFMPVGNGYGFGDGFGDGGGNGGGNGIGSINTSDKIRRN